MKRMDAGRMPKRAMTIWAYDLGCLFPKHDSSELTNGVPPKWPTYPAFSLLSTPIPAEQVG